MATASVAVAHDDRVLVIEWTFDAPRALVWRMFADPQHMVAWMGPREYPAAS
jgi:uncharacterized protein YndB with AHSA1/START domain